MKKLLYLLILLPLGLLASCSSDDDLPDVNVFVSFDNVVADNNELYVVRGDTLKITSVHIKGNSTTAAIINGVNYRWDYSVLIWQPIAPYNVSFLTDKFREGPHVLSMYMDIAQVDKTLAYGVLEFKVNVVPDKASLPGSKVPGPFITDLYMGANPK